MLISMTNKLIPAALLGAMMSLISGCSSTPKASTLPVAASDAKDWLVYYCSPVRENKPLPELTGSLMMKARTQEFKGQYPASLHFDSSGAFQLEITNILGGTLVQLLGGPPGTHQALEIKSPTRPKYNRKGIQYYLGLEVGILTQLLHGDLPCPAFSGSSVSLNKISVDGAKMVIETSNWRWIFSRAVLAEQEIPVEVQLIPMGGAPDKRALDQSIEMQIEDWDRTGHFARKVYLKTPEGELHWAWRTREEVPLK